MLDSLFYYSYSLVYYVSIGVVLLGIGLYFFQDKLIYQPNPMALNLPTPAHNPPKYKNPSERGMQYEDIYLTTCDGVRIHCWFIKHPTPKATIVFFHANAGNIGLRMDNFEQLYNNLEVSIFVVSYRGYGYSDGKPSEIGIMRDADATISYVFNQLPVDRTTVFIFGRSLGGAVAIYIASKYTDLPIKGVIIENTFTSMADMVDVVMPKMAMLKSLVLRNYWPSLERIRKIKIPILFVSGLVDELVPSAHMKRLQEAAAGAVFLEYLEVPTGDHNSTWKEAGDGYSEKIREFIKRAK